MPPSRAMAETSTKAEPVQDPLATFPRSSWELGSFRNPPFTDEPCDFTYRAAWAAYFASQAWAKASKKATSKSEKVRSEWQTLFTMAVLDKVLQLTEMSRKEKAEKKQKIPKSTEEWLAEVEDNIQKAYDLGLDALTPAARANAPQLCTIAPIYRTYLAWDFRARRDARDVPPFLEDTPEISVLSEFDPMLRNYEWIRPESNRRGRYGVYSSYYY